MTFTSRSIGFVLYDQIDICEYISHSGSHYTEYQHDQDTYSNMVI